MASVDVDLKWTVRVGSKLIACTDSTAGLCQCAFKKMPGAKGFVSDSARALRLSALDFYTSFY